MIRAWGDVASLDEVWSPSDAPPLGTDLRTAYPGEWVRFHTLPLGERIAATDEQRAEQLHRYVTVLGALNGLALVLTVGWGGTQEVDIPATLWRKVPGYPTTDVYASAVDTTEDLVPLLRQVARDEAHDVIIGSADLRWMLHPYDGGMDVVGDFPSTLAQRFREWLSPRDDGL